MNTSSNRRKQVNPIHVAPLFKWLTLAVIVAACGLLFVYVKNQQHLLGERTRGVERQIREMKSYNEVLLARISALSSRAELQRKLDTRIDRVAADPGSQHRPADATSDGWK